jgi:DNA-binding response OmpR family regulator
MKKRILIVEDDTSLARILSDNFTFEGFDVCSVFDGNKALDAVHEFAPDLVVLDVTLPGRSGFELCNLIRRAGQTLIIMLTARGQKADKLKGLGLGADDYVTKPFDLEEFLARVHALFRRAHPPVERLVLGHVIVDFEALTASEDGHPIYLNHREFEVLRYLAERSDRIVYRSELLREVWGYHDVPHTRSVDHAIARLRKKIERDPHHPRFIHTVHGDGYRLTVESSTSSAHTPS